MWRKTCFVIVMLSVTQTLATTIATTEATTTSPVFTWGSEKKLHIVRIPQNEEELTSIIFAVTKATEDQTRKLLLKEMKQGRVQTKDELFLTRKLEIADDEKLGSLEGWTPRYGVARLDRLGPFAKEKAFEKIRQIARNRNIKSVPEIMILETYKDIRLLREDLQLVETHQYYIIAQISIMVILVIYKFCAMIRKYKKQKAHNKAIEQRKERMELLKQIHREVPSLAIE